MKIWIKVIMINYNIVIFKSKYGELAIISLLARIFHFTVNQMMCTEINRIENTQI